MNTVMNCQQSAAYLGVSVKTIRRWAQSGKLQGQKVGTRGDWRFSREQLDALIQTEPTIPVPNADISSITFNHSPVAMTVVRAADGAFIEVNELFLELTGYKRSEVIGRTITEISGVKGKTAAAQINKLKAIPYGMKRTEYVREIKNKSGKTRTIRGSLVAANINGEKHLIISHADVTERENSIKNSHYLAAITNSIADAVISLDPKSNIVTWNKGAEKMYGWKEKEVIGKNVAKLLRKKIMVNADSIAEAKRVVATKGVWRGESIHYQKNGEPLRILSTVAAIYNDAGKFVGSVALYRDISELRKIEAERAASMEKVINTLESIDESFLQVDANLEIVMINEAFVRLTGVPRSVLLGRKLSDVLLTSPNSPKPTLMQLTEAVKNQTPIQFPDYYFEPLKIWIDIRGYPTEGGMSMFIRDITKEKQAEEKHEELLKLSVEREHLIKINQAKDEFVGIASHQLRTPATAVKQYIGLILEGFGGPVDENQLKLLEMANFSNERQIKLINDLLRTAKIDSSNYRLKRKSTDIASLIQSAITNLQPQIDERGQTFVVNNLAKNVKATVDATEIELVFANLLENASKYSFIDGTITVTLPKVAKTLQISVADNGIGIHTDDYDKIFGKFTRLSSKQSNVMDGTGFGLYWVKQIVQMHDGDVAVAPNEPKGTVFTVTLPLASVRTPGGAFDKIKG